MQTIREIVEKAGGVHAIAAASLVTTRPITWTGVAKWRQRGDGIPERYWPIIMMLCKVTPAQLHAANEHARRVSGHVWRRGKRRAA